MRKFGFILAQIIIWILFCFIPILFAPPLREGMHHPAFESPLAFLFIFFIKNIKFILLFYFHYLVLIPRFFNQKKYATYIVSVVILLMFVIAFPMLVEWLMPHRPFNLNHTELHSHGGMHKHNHGKPNRMFGGENGIHFFMSILIGLLPFLLTIYKNWISVQKERTEMELAFLKSQINHHFLFNSLNSIYSLSLQNNPQTPPSIHSLSYIMRYILDESVKEKTRLDKELDYLQHYISLQRLRLNPKVNLTYNVIGEVNDQVISPMILIPFIENCFKHGLSTVKPCEILIEIQVQLNSLVLNTRNEIFDKGTNAGIESGIGVANVTKRLNFDYPDKYSLSLEQIDNHFVVELKLNLQ